MIKITMGGLIPISLGSCCANPDIKYIQDCASFKEILRCANCKLYMAFLSGDTATDLEIATKWNEMTKERDKKKRDIANVDINIYPFVFAMK